MSKIKDENYFIVSGWMLNQLKLKGTALNVYAIIYGFTQDGESEFKGSRQYLSDFTGTTKPTIDKALDELIESGLILKNSETINNITFNKYKINKDALKNFTGSKETLPLGSKETLPNNNIKINKDLYILLNEQPVEVQTVLKEFLEMRKTIKKPMTKRAFEMLLHKLQKLSSKPSDQVKILEQSILHCWQDVYELKENKGKTQQREYSKEELNNLYDNLENIEF